ncbi:MAG: hypothetical protein H0X15_03380 [Acidobacteria bacterium]|jgi:hypothetical protein|nr:hypothetical protein [Acidobacteriota bacterium]MBA4123857.1 hypothetical protein [Acidobacteriota bacterium]MBA4184845.1 hypothetical protein [Acidobacteriota bacterium]HEV8159313.1 hypothetical protein [Pyrinomonadaceae bacterium]
MKIKIIFFLIISLLLSTGVYAQKQDATVMVQSFYKFHLSRSGIFNANEVKARKKWFTDDLNRLFQTELQREKEYLKANPTDKPHFGDGFMLQSLDECESAGKLIKNSYTVGAAMIRDDNATVEVKFYSPKECGGDLIDTYKVELVKSKGKWLIDDWLYSDAKTLTEDLKRANY